MYDTFNKKFFAYGLLAIGMCANQVLADWYSNDPELNQKQGFGDFPPATIEQDLQLQTNQQNAVTVYESEVYSGSGSLTEDKVPVASETEVSQIATPAVNIYHQAQQPAPVYGGYNQGVVAVPIGRAPGYGGPWNNRGQGYYSPRNRRGSIFSPWGSRGGFW